MRPTRSFRSNFLFTKASVVLFLTLGGPRVAAAYCTLHTCKDVSEADVKASNDPSLETEECQREGICIVEGHELFWDTPCLTFGVSALNTSALELTPDEFHDIIVDAYKVWEGVECPGGGSPRFQANSVGIVDSNGNFFCEEEPLANLSVWSLVTRWSRDANALGFTSSTHNKRDGEIFDADVELNLNKIQRDHQGNFATVLGRIAVHEAGHYLGLAHSSEGDAVMYESYSAFELLTRELTQDDIDGICKLYPPAGKLECSEPGYVEGALDQAACDDAAAEADNDQPETTGCSIEGVGQHGGRSPWLPIGLVLAICAVAKGRKWGANSVR